ncbi:MAG: Fe-S cluster assembly protein SufD [Candidatus Liberibacter europaeus]|uniref:Fe-S cluster assembly protein SufD n=1 Tax=Candidatus Liberibacter europaeus TaxID=744859 RepID=A0A2T4VX16_9HYPH|nr:Fe-S cluster assembly protein SufD [Candidatus Liberibacter europaeus]PTL86325.1 MAG: Fe-S cluster assembly protein SufD [Candidatus Liberibacter europaeus]
MDNLTKAETILFQACDMACKMGSQNKSIVDFRKHLLCNLRDHGFLPTRKIENWHYTDLKKLLKIFPTDEDKSQSLDEEFECLVAESIKMVLDKQVPCFAKEKEIQLLPFSNIIGTDEEKSLLLEPLDEHDAIGHINAILAQDGCKVLIPDGCHLNVPLELQSVQCGGQKHLRYSVMCGVESEATIVERYIAPTDSSSLVSSVTDIRVCSGAKIVWIIVQDQRMSDTYLGQMRVVLEQNSSLKIFVLNVGEGLVRRELSVEVEGEGSDFMLRGISLLKGSTHNDLSMFLRHKVPGTSSTSIVRNVVLDNATGVFQGIVRVSPEAQGSDARMSSNTLLLSDKGSFFVKPELEIFADDVQCGHGATISDVNHDHLYYLMARGIPSSKAYIMLFHAFVSEIIKDLDDELLQKSLERYISIWMQSNFINS